MTSFKRLGQACVLVGAWLVTSQTAWGSDIPGYPERIEAYDPREVAMLPGYCIHTQLFRNRVPGGNNAAEIRRWETIMGRKIFSAMHHYCWGLMKTNRALYLSRTKQWRTFYLRSAAGEFDYVITRAPQDFALLPEILTKKGENLLRLGDAGKAAHELHRAVRLKPDYWPAYAALSDCYKAAGDLPKAREMVQKALSLRPDAKSLRRRLNELEKVKAR